MKVLLITIVSFVCLISKAQTAIIAHKSHSGTAANFFIDPNSNFGEPGPQLIQIIRLNDSTCVNVYSDWSWSSGSIYHDTVHDRISYELNIDSLQQMQNNRVEYINFKYSPDSAKVKPPTNRPIQTDQTPIKKQQKAPVKKKNSYLLFLFGITGGGLLMFRIFNRVFSPQIAS